MRTAGDRTSGGNLLVVGLLIAPPSQGSELPADPARFSQSAPSPSPPATHLDAGDFDPVADRLCGQLELPGEAVRITPSTNQVNHPAPEIRRIRSACLGHGIHLLRKRGVSTEAGPTSTPILPCHLAGKTALTPGRSNQCLVSKATANLLRHACRHSPRCLKRAGLHHVLTQHQTCGNSAQRSGTA